MFGNLAKKLARKEGYVKKKQVSSKKSKFPPWPSLGWDYGAKMAAAQQLVPPNKCICLYCHNQAKTEAKIIHDPECPVPENERS